MYVMQYQFFGSDLSNSTLSIQQSKLAVWAHQGRFWLEEKFFVQNSKKSPDYFWFCIFTARYARTNVKIYSKVEHHTPEKRLRDALETPQRHIREWRLCLICCWLNEWVSEHIMCLNIYHVILIHLSIYHLFVSSHWFACSHCGSS